MTFIPNICHENGSQQNGAYQNGTQQNGKITNGTSKKMPGVARPGDISKNHLEYMTQLDATGNGPSRRYRLSGIICTMGKKSLLIPPRKVQLLVFCCCLRLSTVRAQHIQFSSNKS
ncbi:uncharacterized protein LOC120352614 isoform X2 [Nilaparvata lugens]|uniref:uncharacterized protein LOC120352614 isoform X2 n=1 Tax=Nilaparvata lugens TaxID=108931 RepID=UPI00193EA9F3|nr:uncharacterized protein LOC120352614 isoform X2 [Nilaparvata lugens]